MVKLKQVESYLSGVQPFAKPKYQLEQYNTSAHIAARMVFAAETSYGDLDGKVVADFGCGTGMLAIGAAIMGAAHVVGFELDPDAIAVARSNVEAMDLEEDVDIVHCDVRRVPVRLGEGGVSGAAGAGKGVVAAAAAESASAAGRGQPSALAEEEQSEQQQRQEGREEEAEAPGGAGENLFDTALMNPPFGTRQKGVDMAFLRAGLDAVRGGGGAVYSMHKTSTRDFIAKTCKRWWVPRGDEIQPDPARILNSSSHQITRGDVESFQVLAELKFDVPKIYKFHRDKSRDIKVDLIRLVKK